MVAEMPREETEVSILTQAVDEIPSSVKFLIN
jgi:hypothetical protein